MAWLIKIRAKSEPHPRSNSDRKADSFHQRSLSAFKNGLKASQKSLKNSKLGKKESNERTKAYKFALH